MLFGKTCPSCLLGQIPGQAAQPTGETWRAGRTAPPELPPEEAARGAGQLGSTLHLSEARPGASGKPREAKLPGGCGPTAPPLPSQHLGWGDLVPWGSGFHWLLPDRRTMRTRKTREAEESGLGAPLRTGAQRGDGKSDSPEGVSGGEVSLDGQVTPHLLPTPDTQDTSSAANPSGRASGLRAATMTGLGLRQHWLPSSPLPPGRPEGRERAEPLAPQRSPAGAHGWDAAPRFSEAGRPLGTQEKHLSAEATRTQAFSGRGR